MELNKIYDFEEHIRTLNYLVIYPDKSTKFYKSLRKITEDICVDYTTISKKLKDDDSCYVTSRVDDYMYYVKKMKFVV
tara:strand:- start:4942 stop:5175 length:234 start_codon:yes stop_codon:yes gene_type:complete